MLIFDEATSALDRDTEENIKQTIYSLKENRLIIMISHNPASLQMATHIYNLEEEDWFSRLRSQMKRAKSSKNA